MKQTASRTALLAAATLLPLIAPAAVVPLPVTGWTDDMIINNGSPSYDQSITGTVDNGAGVIEGGTFAAADTYPVQPSGAQKAIAGLTRDIYTSANGSGATFQFQDFSSSNSLLLRGGMEGTLDLVTPATMTKLSLFGTSGNGATAATVTLTFTDASTSDYPITSGITADWFNFSGSNATVALPIGHRESNHHEDNYATIFTDVNSVISIYQSDITLTAADQLKKVASVSITRTGLGGGTLAVMAISSDAAGTAPVDLKITSSSFDFTAGQATLNFSSTSGVTYRVTHSSTLNGTDWAQVGSNLTANGPASTFNVSFTKGVKDFFRVEVAP